MKRRIFAILLCSLVGGGLALGQSGTDTPATPDPDAGQLEIPVAAEKVLTPEEQAEEIERIQEYVHGAAAALAVELAQARKDDDVMLVTCLEEKAKQAQVAGEIVDAHATVHAEAMASGNASSRDHEFTLIAVVRTRIENLVRDAEACAGKDLLSTGPTRVSSSVAPGTPQDDATNPSPVPDLQIPFITPPATGAF
ncbi:MAG: hypothetical protein R3A78_01865 [Polyangiales bacterium]